MNKILKNKLKELDFSDVESSIFLVLIEKGKLNATNLSKELKVPKTTIYNALEKLIDYGFVITHKLYHGRDFEANINAINTYVQKLEEKVDEYKNIAMTLIPDLETIKQRKDDMAQFKIYYGIDGIKQVIWNVLKAKTEIYYYTSADRRKLFGDKWIKRYWEEFVQRNLHEKGFESSVNINVKPEEYFSISPGYLERSEYKFVKDLNSKGEVYIYNNVYAFYTWEREEYLGVEIYNEALAFTQRSIFEKMWKNF